MIPNTWIISLVLHELYERGKPENPSSIRNSGLSVIPGGLRY